MKERFQSIDVLHVTHCSSVAAIPTAAGPARLLERGLAPRLAALGAQVRVIDVAPPRDRSLNPVAEAFAVADIVSRRVAASLSEGRFAIVLSGSCHNAVGAVAALNGTDRGVIWLDCHADFNTPETTSSGLLDGTTLATITGRSWSVS